MNTTITTESERKTILLSKKGMKELRRAISQLEVEQHGIMKELRESDKTSGHDDRFERNERLARLETVQAELVEKANIDSRTAHSIKASSSEGGTWLGS